MKYTHPFIASESWRSEARAEQKDLSLCEPSVIQHVLLFREHHHLLTLGRPSFSLIFSFFLFFSLSHNNTIILEPIITHHSH